MKFFANKKFAALFLLFVLIMTSVPPIPARAGAAASTTPTTLAEKAATAATIVTAVADPTGTILSLASGADKECSGFFDSFTLRCMMLALILPVLRTIGIIIMAICAFLLSVVGFFFDYVIEFTILEVANTIGNKDDLGGGIQGAWASMRNIANMFFIFLLLFAAFKSMLLSNSTPPGKTIKNIIIFALIINFSLFFTKVVIDASNIVAVGFYNSIANGNKLKLTSAITSESTPVELSGIAGGYMRALGLQNFYSNKVLDDLEDPVKIMIYALGSSVFMLISAVLFLIMSVLFMARYIILIFLMILAPLAFIAYIVPGYEEYFGKWKEGVINQSFFAPMYFALTWCVFKILNSPGFANALKGKADGKDMVAIFDDPFSSIILIFNFVIVIGLSIAALVLSKQVAVRGSVGQKAFTPLAQNIGKGAAGGIARGGRRVIGGTGRRVAQNRRILNATAKKGFVGRAARAAVAAGNKAQNATFDVRASKVASLIDKGEPGIVSGILGKAGTQGRREIIAAKEDEKKKKKADYAKNVLGQTAAEKAKTKKAKKDKKIGLQKLNEDHEEERVRLAEEHKAKKDKASRLKEDADIAVNSSTNEIKKKRREAAEKAQEELNEATKVQADNKLSDDNKIAQADKALKEVESKKGQAQKKLTQRKLALNGESDNVKKLEIEKEISDLELELQNLPSQIATAMSSYKDAVAIKSSREAFVLEKKNQLSTAKSREDSKVEDPELTAEARDKKSKAESADREAKRAAEQVEEAGKLHAYETKQATKHFDYGIEDTLEESKDRIEAFALRASGTQYKAGVEEEIAKKKAERKKMREDYQKERSKKEEERAEASVLANKAQRDADESRAQDKERLKLERKADVNKAQIDLDVAVSDQLANRVSDDTLISLKEREHKAEESKVKLLEEEVKKIKDKKDKEGGIDEVALQAKTVELKAQKDLLDSAKQALDESNEIKDKRERTVKRQQSELDIAQKKANKEIEDSDLKQSVQNEIADAKNAKEQVARVEEGIKLVDQRQAAAEARLKSRLDVQKEDAEQQESTRLERVKVALTGVTALAGSLGAGIAVGGPAGGAVGGAFGTAAALDDVEARKHSNEAIAEAIRDQAKALDDEAKK